MQGYSWFQQQGKRNEIQANLKAIEARKQAEEQQAKDLREFYNFLGQRRMEDEAAELKVVPQVGLRVRLSSLASSKWADTGGEKSKFGLSAAQLLSVVERFRAAKLAGRSESVV